jgi:cellulose 1,4-beta-cellobiosidase
MKLHLPGSRRTRVVGAVAAGAALLGAAGLIAIAGPASAAAGCRVNYSVNDWGSGFTASVTVTNLGDAVNGWVLEWDYAGSQRITQSWNGVHTQTGTHVAIRNLSWNGAIATNGSVNPGFQATYSGSNVAPTSFKLNGVTCTGATTPTTAPTTTPTTTPPTTTTPTTAPTTNPPGPGNRVDNPYVGKGYVNPEWRAKANAEPGGSRVSNTPTAVWLDRIAAIEGTDSSSSNGSMGLRDHLDAALAQGASYAQFVIYNLPGRDCAALASNGELGPTEIDRYKSAYIDPIAAIQADPKYAALRIINIVEIDSLPNLVTNVAGKPGATAMCDTMKANGNYEKGIAYALGKFYAIPNTYSYVDAAHHGWIGWDSNFGPAAELFASVARSASGGMATVHGFIVNTANYSALRETNFSITSSVNGTSVRQSKWVDWNFYVDELTFAQAFRDKLVSLGFPSGIGMLIDTSRNGWGGAARPAGPSASTNLDTFVNESRIDRRIHAGNWCNQSGAGLGERPKAAPAAGIDAYVWVKPPGESDGSSTQIPNNEGKGFDRMCDPTYGGNARNGNSLTGSLPGAPISGAWFSAQFQQLMQNAYPAL